MTTYNQHKTKMRNEKPSETNPTDWRDWWVNPVENGSAEPDPADLAATQVCIERIYTPEEQAQIRINVRDEIEE